MMLRAMLPRERLCVIFKLEEGNGAVAGLPNSAYRPPTRNGDFDQGATRDAFSKLLKRITFALNLHRGALIVGEIDPMQCLSKRHCKPVRNDRRGREQSILKDIILSRARCASAISDI
jgi:hypothetical protein